LTRRYTISDRIRRVVHVMSEFTKGLLGVLAWGAVAAFALVAVANWDPLWGFFPVLAAVVVVWAVGEWVLNPRDEEAA
jgi:hypothetical protein